MVAPSKCIFCGETYGDADIPHNCTEGTNIVLNYDYMDEICANCGCRFGSHHAGTSPWPRDYCPGHEGKMDWENGPGTVFKSTDKYMSAADAGQGKS